MSPPQTPALLRAHGLARAFGPEPAVTGVDLHVEPGEIHALVGLNGAGKTTLMRLLLGMLRPDAGRATLHLGQAGAVPAGGARPGNALPGDSGSAGAVPEGSAQPDAAQDDVGGGPGSDVRDAPAATWRGVGHLVESPFLYAELTVTETVHAAARLRGLPAQEARKATDRVITDLALEHWAGRRCRTLSLGNRQRVGLACAVVHRPQLLVLDEPTNALDPAGVLRVRRHLVEAAGRGVGVLVSSHHLDEMARIAHRITVMHRGAVIGTLPPHGTDLELQFFDMVYAAEGVDPRDPTGTDLREPDQITEVP